ncbi:MAG: XdhC family protein [Chthoniobacter sp.]|nr:XdhC family protein [Chthoniobacter sp.]
MKTIQAIVELARETPAGEVLAMATVMKVRGSAYRRPGARMLVNAAGRTAGMISGGCLENDVCERARKVMATGVPILVTYDSTAPEDIVFGLGLGCNGVVEVLIERLTAGDETGLLAFLSSCVARRQIGRIATVFQSDVFPLGARLLRWPDGSITSSLADPALTAALLRTFQETAARRTALRQVELPDGRAARVLVEAVTPPVPLTIFGAADDAVPVAQLAKSIGWHVTVIDARPAYATPERFPTADAVHCLRPEALLASPHIVLPPDALVMIMTHNFTHDRALLGFLLGRPLRYLGVLGPKSRTQRLLDELADSGLVFSSEKLAHLHGPAGLDIGAETPEEIAVSIIGEMQAALAQRHGGALRDRTAPIHDPADQPAAVA